jgi:hypothetical protein
LAEAHSRTNRTPDSPPAAPGDLSVNQVVNAYRKFAKTYYVKNGAPTKELTCMKYAARPLRKLYGRTLARDFGPLALKAVRTLRVDAENLSRGVVNSYLVLCQTLDLGSCATAGLPSSGALKSRTAGQGSSGIPISSLDKALGRIQRIFKWAVSEQLIPPSVYEGLRCVEGLRYGRTTARET